MPVNFLAGVTSFLVAAGDDVSLDHTGSQQAAAAFLGDVGFGCRRQQKRKRPENKFSQALFLSMNCGLGGVVGARDRAGSRTWGETYTRSPKFATTTAVGGRALGLGLWSSRTLTGKIQYLAYL